MDSFFYGTVISARFLGNEAKQHRADLTDYPIPFCVRTKLYGIMWTYPKTVMSFHQHNSYFLKWLGNSLYRILFQNIPTRKLYIPFQSQNFSSGKTPAEMSCLISLSKAFFQQTDISYFPGTESFILNCITSLNFVAIYGKWEWVMLISKQWTQTGFSISKFGFFWPLRSEFARARGKLNLNPC